MSWCSHAPPKRTTLTQRNTTATVVSIVIFGVVTWVLFLLIEYRIARSPIIPFGVFNTWQRLSPLLATLFHGFVLSSSTYFLPLYF